MEQKRTPSVFKFGGASVKNPSGVIKLKDIAASRLQPGDIIVVSAMGKTTENLEAVVELAFTKKPYGEDLKAIRLYHLETISMLFTGEELEAANQNFTSRFLELEQALEDPGKQRRKFTDHILAFGELMSTRIVADYLSSHKLPVVWQDVRKFMKTDNQHGGAGIRWEETEKLMRAGLCTETHITVTQGYIGSTATGDTTTLGKEGSDFTAAILARCCHAQSVTFWKDVPGVFSADPNRFPEAVQLKELSYRYMVELTYFGAKVIHPKTMKPLAEKNIPLYVKSFLDPELPGTCIRNAVHKDPEVPQMIFKNNQVLVTFRITDLAFIGDDNFGRIFQTLDQLNVRANMIHTTAVTCSFVFDWQEEEMQKLQEVFRNRFSMRFNRGLTLATFKFSTPERINECIGTKKYRYMEQSTRNQTRVLYRE